MTPSPSSKAEPLEIFKIGDREAVIITLKAGNTALLVQGGKYRVKIEETQTWYDLQVVELWPDQRFVPIEGAPRPEVMGPVTVIDVEPFS